LPKKAQEEAKERSQELIRATETVVDSKDKTDSRVMSHRATYRLS
jgi:hypothetical protein